MPIWALSTYPEAAELTNTLRNTYVTCCFKMIVNDLFKYLSTLQQTTNHCIGVQRYHRSLLSPIYSDSVIWPSNVVNIFLMSKQILHSAYTRCQPISRLNHSMVSHIRPIRGRGLLISDSFILTSSDVKIIVKWKVELWEYFSTCNQSAASLAFKLTNEKALKGC